VLTCAAMVRIVIKAAAYSPYSGHKTVQATLDMVNKHEKHGCPRYRFIWV